MGHYSMLTPPKCRIYTAQQIRTTRKLRFRDLIELHEFPIDIFMFTSYVKHKIK